jgi:aryl-alcohol dehydrogenase-like predicted oxidoreductase
MPLPGNPGLDVFPLSPGGNTFGWTTDEAASFAVLDACAAAGGNFIDTADSYPAFAPGSSGGESGAVIGAWLAARGNREQVIGAARVSRHPQFKGLPAASVAAACDASPGRLRAGRIGLHYARRDGGSTPPEEAVAAFAALQKAGKVGHAGLSNYAGARLREWIAVAQATGAPLPGPRCRPRCSRTATWSPASPARPRSPRSRPGTTSGSPPTSRSRRASSPARTAPGKACRACGGRWPAGTCPPPG